MALLASTATKTIERIRCFSLFKRTFKSGIIVYANKKNVSSPAAAAPKVANVPGLSDAVVKVSKDPVGPGASKSSPNYKNPEYFCYDKTSYFEAEIEMLKYRCPQPSTDTPYFQKA